MKKWLIGCLTVLAMVCLIPGIVLKAAAETTTVRCKYCGSVETREVRGYGNYDSVCHRVYVTKCQNCQTDAGVIYLRAHTGSTETPTCTTGKTCEKCHAKYDIHSHVWGEWTPNYASNGTHTRRCKRCNAEETGSCSGGYATCDSLGMCNTCGGSYYGGHAWGEWSSAGNGTHTRRCTNYCREVDTANCTGGTATCSAKAVCEVCGKEYGEKDSSNHDRVHHEAKAPTCTDIGWDAFDTCKNCDYTDYQEIPALKHNLVYYKAKDPTCTEPGCDAYETCSRCDYTTYVERPALKHDLRQRVIKAPTCTQMGWAYENCSRCDYFATPLLPVLNHDLKQHAAKAPTCTEKGWNAYDTCKNCDYTTYAEQPALNHDLKQYAAKAPTCTEKGWNAYETCSRCDYTTYVELPAQHDLVHHDAQAATCTGIGWNAYETCSRCNYTTYAELPALNHDYQAVTVEPTCETDGYTVFTCSRCKDSYTADPTDKLGHQFGAWSPNGTGAQSADCLRQGCAHTGSTDCRKFTFRTAEGEMLTFCPVCGQAENAAQLEKIEAATAWTISGSLSAEDVTARTNGEYLSVAFETAGSLTQPTGRVRLALPAGLLEGKTLVRIAPDGTQTELPFEAKNGKLIFTLDFVNSELPVMLFRLVPQTAAL